MTTVSKQHIVLDTNVLISAALFPQSVSAGVLEKAFDDYQPVFTLATWAELANVIMRNKLDRYLTPAARHLYLAKLASMVQVVAVQTGNGCRRIG